MSNPAESATPREVIPADGADNNTAPSPAAASPPPVATSPPTAATSPPPAATSPPPAATSPTASPRSPTVAPSEPEFPSAAVNPALDALPELAEENPVPLQVDYDIPSDHDSAYGSDTASNYTASVTSSIYNYRYENGRRYHAYREGQYVLPNDDQEQDRLNLQHHIWRLLLGGHLYNAPLPDPSSPEADDMRILDLGTGTGVWAVDMADEFPSANVFGVDLSPIQPEWVPVNCRFHVDDYEDEWMYNEDEKFDYIHGRALGGTSADWPRFYGRVMENLKPGGWVEMQEYDAWIFSDDDSCDRAPWTMEWVEKLDEASMRFGKRINVARYHKQWMIDAGFEDVHEEVKRIPIGPWAKDPVLKELGRYERVHMQMSVDSHTPALFTRVLGYTENQARILMEGVKREFRNQQELRLITTYRFITGRRPMN